MELDNGEATYNTDDNKARSGAKYILFQNKNLL